MRPRFARRLAGYSGSSAARRERSALTRRGRCRSVDNRAESGGRSRPARAPVVHSPCTAGPRGGVDGDREAAGRDGPPAHTSHTLMISPRASLRSGAARGLKVLHFEGAFGTMAWRAPARGQPAAGPERDARPDRDAGCPQAWDSSSAQPAWQKQRGLSARGRPAPSLHTLMIRLSTGRTCPNPDAEGGELVAQGVDDELEALEVVTVGRIRIRISRRE